MFPFIEAPDVPYFAVIFTSALRSDAAPGYEDMANAMVTLARQQPGYLGFESARGDDGLGMTISYWESEDAIKAWKAVADHKIAQTKGKSDWYEWFHVRVARVERGYSFQHGK